MEIKELIKNKTLLYKAFEYLVKAKKLTEWYEYKRHITSKYVHATSRGHEAIQIAVGMQLKASDYVSPYYRDDALLLAMGISPEQLMLQLLAKKDDIFSGGRTYYSHASLKEDRFPKIIHQSSATGMQAIPSAGIAMGLKYKELSKMDLKMTQSKPLVVCSLGEASCTEGEVSEAFQTAAHKQLPILFLVQDNGWDISAKKEEVSAQSISQYVSGIQGLEVFEVDGSDFIQAYECVKKAFKIIREQRRPVLIHAHVPLLNHHTSGVRMEWYRDDLVEAKKKDPYLFLKKNLLEQGFSEDTLKEIEDKIQGEIEVSFEKALAMPDPSPEDLYTHVFAPSPIKEELGERAPLGKTKVLMVDAALFALREILNDHKEAVFYGQDVGRRLGGVFREAATLADEFGDHRVFNTAIQEAFIVGSTVGMSAVGLKPIVEVQFADYIWPGLNQLFTEVSRSNYLTNGKWPVSMVLRVPIGAYGSGGPYHSSSVEGVLTQIKGIKVVYPSNAADMKGLMKSAFYDGNPVVVLEHKGLYWSKIKGTEEAADLEPDKDYRVPIGKGRYVLKSEVSKFSSTVSIITYGMGVYWAKEAAKSFPGQVEIVDLRSLAPFDEEIIRESIQKNGRGLLLTEEPKQNSFMQSLAGWIAEEMFESLDAPLKVMGAKDLPAIPLNSALEQEMLPNASKVKVLIERLLGY